MDNLKPEETLENLSEKDPKGLENELKNLERKLKRLEDEQSWGYGCMMFSPFPSLGVGLPFIVGAVGENNQDLLYAGIICVLAGISFFCYGAKRYRKYGKLINAFKKENANYLQQIQQIRKKYKEHECGRRHGEGLNLHDDFELI